MSQMNSIEDWPKINSIVAINAGTRLDCGLGRIAIVPSFDEEIIGIVIEHHPQCDYRNDIIDIPLYFNIREIHDDGTSTKF